MSEEITTNLALPLIMPSQAQKHVTHNEALLTLDVLVQASVRNRSLSAAPATPEEGQRHIVGSGATGTWAGQDGRIAAFQNGGWAFYAPRTGWRVHVEDEGKLFTFQAGEWHSDETGVLQAESLGLNATADSVNRLTVSAPATLLNHEGAGHQLKINKATAGDTASLLFQTGFSGQAEMGLAGNNDFAIKVSDDGASFLEGMRLDAATGRAEMPHGLVVDMHLSGTAIQSDWSDVSTPARVVRTDGAKAASLAQFGGDYVTNTGQNIDTVTAGNCGLYLDSNAGTWPLPPSGIIWWISTQRLFNQNAACQEAIRYTSTGPVASSLRYVRTRSDLDGIWGPWEQTITNRSILGPVSQVAGVPTGAIIERGSNANGTFIRFADGTQICTMVVTSTQSQNLAYGALFRTAGLGIVFPAAFSVPPLLIPGATGDTAAWYTYDVPTTTNFFCRRLGVFSSATNVTYRAIAIGQWF